MMMHKICVIIISTLINSSIQQYSFTNQKKANFKFIDDYHFPMVADEIRNNLYYTALQKAIMPNYSHVLDVGAGTMLLSMMSMQLGAAQVLGVEANPLMVTVAKEVLDVNNFSSKAYSNKIHIFEGNFESLYLGYKHVL